MADNLTLQSATPATAPAATVIATDDAGAAGHIQRMKLAIAADGSATAIPADATIGLLVTLGTGLNTTDDAVRTERTGTVEQITPTLAVSTTPDYSIGDVVGGILTLTNAMRVSGGAGLLQSMLVIDRANQKPALAVLLFNALPTDTYTDNAAAPTISTTDSGKLIRHATIWPNDYVTVGGLAVADLDAIFGKAVKAVGSANLYAVLIAASAYNAAATTDLTIRVGIARD